MEEWDDSEVVGKPCRASLTSHERLMNPQQVYQMPDILPVT
jgi:hypothetical protein